MQLAIFCTHLFYFVTHIHSIAFHNFIVTGKRVKFQQKTIFTHILHNSKTFFSTSFYIFYFIFNDYAFIICNTYAESKELVYYRVDKNLKVEKFTSPSTFTASGIENPIKVSNTYWTVGENNCIYNIAYNKGRITIKENENKTIAKGDITEFKVAYNNKILAVHYHDMKPNEWPKKTLRVYDNNVKLVLGVPLPDNTAYVSLVDIVKK